MIACSQRTKQWIAFSIILLAFLLFVVGYSTPYWTSEVDSFGDESYFGIWRSCFNVAGNIICTDWIDVTTTEGKCTILGCFSPQSTLASNSSYDKIYLDRGGQ